ncbi:NYN domain-containing protein [Antribacter gilvus]|uniref:NYN domain-containing protein n=1 Tax=Antribacter gilvus TaxID=2304675 RepID=UPI00197CD9D9|nr:NYN domain-containing protein [Antribacter gilvus]
MTGRNLIAYIDGFNLYHGLHEVTRRRKLWLDVVDLTRRLRPRSRLVQVKYFTAHVLDQPAALSRQENYLNALRAQNPGLLTITLGRYQKRMVACRSCGHVRPHYEEKQTDVNIATEIVADALAGRCQDALIISADSDLVPAVTMAQRLPGYFAVAAFPPGRHSNDLKRLMPASFGIHLPRIAQAQLPSVVKDQESGTLYARPPYWT